MATLVGRTFPDKGEEPAKAPAKGKAGATKGKEPEKTKTAGTPRE